MRIKTAGVLIPVLVSLYFSAVPAHAGFLTGYVIGSMGSSKSQNSGTSSVFSDTHDVIVCRADTSDNRQCDGRGSPPISPNVYAATVGYKKLYRVGVTFNNGHPYIIMEVSK